MKKTRIFLLILFALLLSLSLLACGDAGDDLDDSIPQYLGMSVSQMPSTEQATLNNQSSNVPIKRVDATSEQDTLTVIEGQNIILSVNLHNPENYEILSFTLNGYKFQSYEFEYGSTGQKLLLKRNVGSGVSEVEYTIEQIKYVDGTTIKDVAMKGNQTIKINVLAFITVQQPTFEGTLTFGDELPTITTVTEGGTISLNSNQILTAGTNSYAWTFTPFEYADRYLNTSGTILLTVNKAEQILPGDLTLQVRIVYESSITAELEINYLATNYEFSNDNDFWSDTAEFLGLEPNTEYTFYVRLKGDANHYPSQAISMKHSTIPNDDEIFIWEDDTLTGLTGFGKTLTDLTIPEKLGNDTIINMGAYVLFYNNTITSLTANYIVFMEKIVECPNLEIIEMNNLERTISGVDIGSKWFTSQPDGVVSLGKLLLRYKGVMAENTTIVIENGIKFIAEDAFRGCTELEKIVLSSSLVGVGASAFYGCSNLATIFYGGTDAEWQDIKFNTSTLPVQPDLYFYSETQPDENYDSFWHWVDSIPTIWHESASEEDES